MGLAEMQRLLAQVATDPQVEEQLVAELSLSAEQVRFFAVGLRRKRLGIARKHLPLTSRALGPEFERLFAQYARTAPLRGTRCYRDDAIGFCQFLQRTVAEASVRECARYEAAWLETDAPGRRLSVRAFWRGGGALAGPYIALWLRLSPDGPLRHTSVPLWPTDAPRRLFNHNRLRPRVHS